MVAYASMNDVGRVINPLIVTGQLDGGAMQGIGQALIEHFVFDPSSGQALTASFLDYALPVAADAPPFRTAMDESTPCRNNAMGIKGVGELGTIGATPAVANAVVDALMRAGLGDQAYALQMPFTSGRVWEALQLAAPASGCNPPVRAVQTGALPCFDASQAAATCRSHMCIGQTDRLDRE